MALLIRTDGTAEATQSPQQNAQAAAVTPAAESGSTKVNTSTSSAGKVAAPATGTTETSAPKAAGIGISAAGSGVDFSALNATYEGKYDQQLADLYNQIVGRKPFQYNSSEDQFYQQYVDRYTKGGQMAMMDTMGQAAELTGGYGSSYGQRVGQQTYDEYMTGLNDKALELEQRAYGRWQDEGAQLQQQYGMLGDLDERDYGRFMDEYGKAADKYSWYLQEAAARADQGDFSGYEQLYGKDVASKMKATWAATNMMPLYLQGLIDEETYKSIVGSYPVGYDPNAVVGGGGGWGPALNINPYGSSVGANSDKDKTWGAGSALSNGAYSSAVVKGFDNNHIRNT